MSPQFFQLARVFCHTLSEQVLTKKRFLIRSLAYCLMFAFTFTALGYNNDGKTDIYWRNYSSGDNAAWLMNGVTYSSSSTLTWLATGNWKMVGTGDFNKDGKLDILWRESTTGNNVVWFMGLSGLSLSYIQALTDTDWEIAGTGYFDGPTDENVDILWQNSVTGDIAIWFMDGPELVSAALLQEVPDLNWKIGGTGDFNGDGHTDIAWRHSTTGLNYAWLMQGSTLITAAQLQTASDTDWEMVGVGYFSGLNDDTVDLLWRDKSSGDNAIWKMNGTTYVSSHTLPWASTSWKVGGTGDAGIDTDGGTGDDLPDLWERNWLATLSYDDDDDPDSDGWDNADEFQWGNDPLVDDGAAPLGINLDAPSLVYSSGGNLPWKSDTDLGPEGDNGSARSGAISHNQSSFLEVTVVGPCNIWFYKKVSSEDDHDWLKAYVNGTWKWSYSGESDWSQHNFSVGSGTHTVRWEYVKDGSTSSGDDAAWIDHILVQPTGSSVSLAEAVDDSDLSWYGSWSGRAGFSSPGGGDDAAESAPRDDDENSKMNTSSVQGPGVLRFSWKVSSEESDYLRFYLDYTDNDPINQISGEVDWRTEYVFVPSGSHTFIWNYEKDYSVSSGLDRGWVDNVHYSQDTDADGLPDDWETQYFGSTSAENGDGDYDADGYNNLQEYFNGTDPSLAELRAKIMTPRQFSLLP